MAKKSHGKAKTPVKQKDAGFDNKGLNLFKWLLVVVLIALMGFANSYYSHVDGPLRAAAAIVVVIIALLIASWTSQGQKAVGFCKQARVELRKVTWPTKPETLQTTLMVVCMVLVTALVLWGLDGVLVNLVGWLVGQRG
jgi:preprotein translocase subunit SecE